MAHPNVEQAIEVYQCIHSKDAERASVLAISPKRKGFVVPNPDATFTLTPKGEEFCKKWLKGTKYSM